MKVKVGDIIYEGTEDLPIMVILTDKDKENIANMLPDANKYAIFSDKEGSRYPSTKSKLDWMNGVTRNSDQLGAKAKVSELIKDPILHTEIEDDLNETHPLAYETIRCTDCDTQIHAINNEMMITWVETGKGNYCLECFVKLEAKGLGDEYGIKP